MITIKNEYIVAQISEKGAELKSLKYNDFEYLWEADPAVWGSSSPVLFPICGGLKDDKYTYEGNEYHLNKHGFVRREIFDVVEVAENVAEFSYKSNEMTRERYPFEFDFRVKFELNNKDLSVTYSVVNLSEKDMYFNFGGHPAFACLEGISSYDLKFEQKETLDAYKVYGNLLSTETDRIITDTDVLHLKDELFIVDSLLFKNINSKSVCLINKLNGRTVRFDYTGYDFLTIWTKPGAKYICLEPWTGTPDFIGTDFDIKQKYAIKSLSPKMMSSQTFVIGLE